MSLSVFVMCVAHLFEYVLRLYGQDRHVSDAYELKEGYFRLFCSEKDRDELPPLCAIKEYLAVTWS